MGRVESFVRLLPDDIPAPVIMAEEDGSMNLEWYTEPYWVFDVSIREDGGLSYAALLGDVKAHGEAQMDDAIPEAILDIIRKVANKGVRDCCGKG